MKAPNVCRNGHSRTLENTRWIRSYADKTKKYATCLICQRARKAVYRAREKSSLDDFREKLKNPANGEVRL